MTFSPENQLLKAWMNLALHVRENRFLAEIPFNQMALCSLLNDAPSGLTAAELCRETGLLKSQMNKEISALDQRGFIIRTGDPADKRRVLITLSPQGADAFSREHQRVMSLFENLSQAMGAEKTLQLAQLLNEAATEASSLIEKEINNGQ